MDHVSPDMSFLEMLDVLNNDLIAKGEESIAFDHEIEQSDPSGDEDEIKETDEGEVVRELAVRRARQNRSGPRDACKNAR